MEPLPYACVCTPERCDPTVCEVDACVAPEFICAAWTDEMVQAWHALCRGYGVTS